VNIRIGHGFDVHAFSEENSQNDLVLAGVIIPFDRSLLAHSDGDVVIHALCDSLLGAAALGDIGRHFSDQDSQYKNISSRVLLAKVMALLQADGLTPANVDITIIAQVPKLAQYMDEMRALLAEDLSIKLNNINIKATTTERLGYLGREEGIAVHVVCLLQS